MPNWSHVEALAHERRLILAPGATSGSWTIGIPTQVLDAVETGAPGVARAPAGKERVEDIKTRVTNHFYGGSHNVAVGSSQFTQAITHGIQPADLTSLLTDAEIPQRGEEDLVDLETAITAPAPENAADSVGDRAKAWFATYGTGTIAGASGTGLAAAVERLPHIARCIEAFAGKM